jgi:N-acetylmuramoyl-L-alanine amidase
MASGGRILFSCLLVCGLLAGGPAPSFPSSGNDAERKFTVACERLSDLKKSSRRKKYRSSWVDCARTFEQVEKRYPSSPAAADACYERASLYLDLYQISRFTRDVSEASKLFAHCQAAYPKHARAPEASYRLIGIAVDYRRDTTSAVKTYEKLAAEYPRSAWTDRARDRLGLKKPEKRRETVIKTAVPENAPAGTVTGIRHWSGGAFTRIVIDVDKPFRFDAREFKDPARLSFDISKASVAEALRKENEPLVINDGILKQVRFSQFDEKTVRVVLDLASIESYAAFPLREPDRLVIDVAGKNGEGAPAVTNDSPAGAAEANGVSPPGGTVARNGNDGPALSLSNQMGLKIETIAIDAGHGGHDPGAIGRKGLREKEVTLDIARRLAALVRNKLDRKVVMTRNNDVFIPLDERPFIAKSRGADLFISIHVNANRKRMARGIETYFQSIAASDSDAMMTAARENAMTTKKMSELRTEIQRILADLTQADKTKESSDFAEVVQMSLVDSVRPHHKHVVNLGVKQAFFYVLTNTQMPSILAEVGFISNPDEEKLLRKSEYRQAIAEALFEGIRKYVEKREPQMAGL